METLPVDDEAARMWARLRIYLAEAARRVRINDLWIAAIAASRGLPVVTRDDDFAALEGAPNVTVHFESDPGSHQRQTSRRGGVLWQCSHRSGPDQLSGIMMA